MSAPGKKMNDAERVEVMLSVLPWLAARGGAPLSEVAEHFGVDRERLRDDLLRVFYDVEPEVGADNMVDVHIDDSDDEWVTVALPGSFEQPPRLDHSEALALLAAGTAFVDERGSELALEPALRKLGAVLGPGAATALDVDLGGGDPDLRRLLRTAVEQQRSVVLEYFAWGSDEVGVRTVDPWAVHSVTGNWYLTGWCHDREASRHFRLDRVLSAEATEDPIRTPAPTDLPHPTPGVGRAEHTVEVTLPVQHVWLVDSFPVESFEDLGDRVRVTVAVYSESWLDRFLVRLPEDATVHDAQGTDLWRRRGEVARRIMIAAGIDPSADSVSA